MVNYQIKITETNTGEGRTFWCPTLNLERFKAMKRELVETAEKYGTEHELTLTRIYDAETCHWLGATTEKVITTIHARACSELERFLSILN